MNVYDGKKTKTKSSIEKAEKLVTVTLKRKGYDEKLDGFILMIHVDQKEPLEKIGRR